jgi:hypothetical protein
VSKFYLRSLSLSPDLHMEQRVRDHCELRTLTVIWIAFGIPSCGEDIGEESYRYCTRPILFCLVSKVTQPLRLVLLSLIAPAILDDDGIYWH